MLFLRKVLDGYPDLLDAKDVPLILSILEKYVTDKSGKSRNNRSLNSVVRYLSICKKKNTTVSVVGKLCLDKLWISKVHRIIVNYDQKIDYYFL